MRFLTSVDTAEEADRIEQLFDASGVPVFVEADYTRTSPAHGGGTFGFRVHIFVDEQEEDARRLLQDPDFELASPIDCEGFYRHLERADEERKARVPQQVDHTMNWLVAMGIVVLIAWGVWQASKAS